MSSIISSRLHSEVEGTCTGRYGYIVCVLTIDSIGKGLVQDSYGFATFDVKYKAIVLKPFKGEVVDAVVSTVNKMGIFAEVGPLQIFISSHLIPSDIKFEANNVLPCYQSDDQTQKISKDDQLRLKIVGTRIDATEIFAIGTIKEDYLGLIS